MDDPTKQSVPDNHLNSDQPHSESGGPTSSGNNQVYGQSQSNVQAEMPASSAKKKDLWIDEWPSWAKIVFGPIFLLLLIYVFIDNFLNFGNAKGARGVVQLVVTAVLLAFAINAFVFQSYEVVGESMLPTLNNGDRLVISKLGKTWGNTFGDGYVPKRGDIVVFDSPISQNRQLIKRVIGLPGEKIIVKDGNITVINDAFPNGFDPDIDYKDSLPLDTSNDISTEVPEGEVFVAGDNRLGGASFDSRNSLGTVPLENVVGNLVLRLLPFDTSRFF